MGAVTLLVAIVAVFLSYNANSGLPFVPTTRLVFESPNGAALTKGNQVREGGRRVGIVTELEPRPQGQRPHRRPDRDQARRLLRRCAGRQQRRHPAAVAERPEVRGAHARREPPGAVRRGHDPGCSSARVPVQLDDLGNMYDAETRKGVQRRDHRGRHRADAPRRGPEHCHQRPAGVPAPPRAGGAHAGRPGHQPGPLPRPPRAHGRSRCAGGRQLRQRVLRGRGRPGGVVAQRGPPARVAARVAAHAGAWASPLFGCSGRSSSTRARPRRPCAARPR